MKGAKTSAGASVETLKRARDQMMQQASPELEKKDEFAASSLWQMAAKAN